MGHICGEGVRGLLPTRGFSISYLSMAGCPQPTFKVWDLGGGRDVRRYWSAYYRKAHSIVFVIDATDRRRLQEVSTTLQEILVDEVLRKLPLLVLANKQDLPNALKDYEVRELSPLAKASQAAFLSRGVPLLNPLG